MFWKYLDRFFETAFWKVLVVLLYCFLGLSVLQLLFVANQSVQYTLGEREHLDPNFRQYIGDTYYYGICAVGVLSFLFLAGIVDLFRNFIEAKQYRILGNTMTLFADGDLGARYKQNATREITKLGGTFNHMADSLQRLIEELQTAEKQRKEMVANVAHDLAGPLTAIAGYTETMAKQLSRTTQANAKDYLEIIRKNINTLSRLITGLSDLSKLDMEEFHIQEESFCLRTLSYDIVSRYALEANNHEIKISMEDDDIAAMVNADVYLIERVISNLVENSIRYTPAGGSIKVSCTEDGKHVNLHVTDSGVGIPSEDIPFIFERFYRVDKDRSRQSGGSGLGLAIVKKIVELHGGNILISSVPGEGTCVTLELPKTSKTTHFQQKSTTQEA